MKTIKQLKSELTQLRQKHRAKEAELQKVIDGRYSAEFVRNIR